MKKKACNTKSQNLDAVRPNSRFVTQRVTIRPEGAATNQPRAERSGDSRAAPPWGTEGKIRIRPEGAATNQPRAERSGDSRAAPPWVRERHNHKP